MEIRPTGANLAEVATVTLCVMNAVRADEGLPALRANALLERASVAHSEDMVRRRYFAHETPDGAGLVDRLQAARYIAGKQDWLVGENLAWGSGGYASPRAIVQAWMSSPGHRRNLLSADYLEVGVGLASGTPEGDAGDGATFTTDFGRLAAPAASPRALSPAAVRRARRACLKKRGAARRRCLRLARARAAR